MKHGFINNRKKFIKTFIQYGLHLWLIIFISNVAIIYAVRFFLFASTPDEVSITPSVTSKPGPIIGISLALPGIGSEGGNLKPLNLEREVSINLYGQDSNISDIRVKPIYSIKTKVKFDDNQNSPTYTEFINPQVDLGNIDKKNYQIAIGTPQTLLSVVKDPGSSSLGGKLYNLSNNNKVTVLPVQKMISGDIYPVGNNDNVMDINDYNMLANCFSSNKASKCPDGVQADLDDNGVVDGVDYNIMLLSFRSLKALGYPVPSIVLPGKTVSASPTLTTAPIAKAQNPTVTPVVQEEVRSSGGAGVLIALLFIVLILGVVGFVLFKLNLLQTLFKGRLSFGKVKNGEEVKEGAGDDSSAEESAEVTSVADVVEESVYLKKVSTDSATNSTWVTLADDNGVVPGLYSGKDVIEGFVKVKGVMKIDKNNKKYMLISEVKEEK